MCTTVHSVFLVAPNFVHLQVKVNVIDPWEHPQQEERLLAGENPALPVDEGYSEVAAAADSNALVPSRANTSAMKRSNMDSEIYFTSGGGEGEALDEGGDDPNRPRRRGPSPIHGGGGSAGNDVDVFFLFFEVRF